jgi:hypothetical protein
MARVAGASRGRARRGHLAAVLALAATVCVPSVTGCAPSATGAQPVEVPGSGAIFEGRGVAVLWGVVRGPDEGRTRVVLRIERIDLDAPWRLASVEAVDPFTGQREWVRLALDLGATPVATVEMSRESFVTKPSRRVLFYPDVAALQKGRPGLVVSYAAIPDSVPEFASEWDLADHFRRVREGLPPP